MGVRTAASARATWGRLSTWLVVLVAIAAGTVLPHAAASAGPAPSLTLSPSSGGVGVAVSAAGYNFPAFSAGTVTLAGIPVAAVTTDRKGNFTARFTIPSTAPVASTNVVAVVGAMSATRAFTVTTSPSTTSSTTSTSSTTTTSTTTPTTSTTTVPTTGSVLFGVSTPNAPYDMSELDVFERDAGKRAGVVMYFQGWAYDEFNPTLAASVAARGSIPEITWEPWDYKLGADQPAYALGRIIDGTHDAYITRWAQGAKAYGGPLLVRFAHEMNDRQYPWSEQVNGNQPGQYAAAWRHVVQIFRAAGANNVSWVWAPNVSYQGTTPLAGLYPGDDYVDWIGVDGYNGGTALPWGGWLTFAQVFGSTLSEISALSPTKPVMIAETASAEAGGSKAAWITDFFAELAARPQIKGFVWFNHNKEADWRIESSDAARLAFAAGVADPRYR